MLPIPAACPCVPQEAASARIRVTYLEDLPLEEVLLSSHVIWEMSSQMGISEGVCVCLSISLPLYLSNKMKINLKLENCIGKDEIIKKKKQLQENRTNSKGILLGYSMCLPTTFSSF